LTATERALVRWLADVERRLRLLEGDYQRQLELDKDLFLTEIAAGLTN
jgi:hypothetical protein